MRNHQSSEALDELLDSIWQRKLDSELCAEMLDWHSSRELRRHNFASYLLVLMSMTGFASVVESGPGWLRMLAPLLTAALAAYQLVHPAITRHFQFRESGAQWRGLQSDLDLLWKCRSEMDEADLRRKFVKYSKLRKELLRTCPVPTEPVAKLNELQDMIVKRYKHAPDGE